MRKLIPLAVVALAAIGALAVHVTRSDAKWHVLSETAINTNKLCTDGLNYTWASGSTTTQPSATRPTGDPRFIGPVDLFIQHAPAGTPDDDADWFNEPLAGAITFTANYAPVEDKTAGVWYPYSHKGFVAFRHPLPPTTEAVRLDTQPNGDSDATTAVEAVHNCTLFAPIDFQPGVSPNVVDFAQNGKPFVALLSTSTYNAANVDPATVFLGKTGTEAAPISSTKTDVNGDGRMDLKLQFLRTDTGILCGDTEVMLSAQDPKSGVRFYETDAIQTINCTP
jgi:hypothetical protein